MLLCLVGDQRVTFGQTEGISVYENDADYSGYYQSAPQPAKPTLLVQNAVEQQPHPTPYQYDCNSPKNRDDADLCEQRRMAQAAEDLVTLTRKQIDLARRQIYLTIGEIVLLIFAVGAACWAAVAATRAVGVARDVAYIELRAYVTVVGATGKITRLGNGAKVALSVTFKNGGKTPARDVAQIVMVSAWPQVGGPLPQATLASA